MDSGRRQRSVSPLSVVCYLRVGVSSTITYLCVFLGNCTSRSAGVRVGFRRRGGRVGRVGGCGREAEVVG